MFEMIGIPPQAFFGQLLLGLINGSFYAVLSLGLALIFGLLNIINFTHGAQYMLGAYVAWLSMSYAGVNYWQSLLIAPVVVEVEAVVLLVASVPEVLSENVPMSDRSVVAGCESAGTPLVEIVFTHLCEVAAMLSTPPLLLAPGFGRSAPTSRRGTSAPEEPFGAART